MNKEMKNMAYYKAKAGIDLTKKPVGPIAEKIEPKKETYKVPTNYDDEGFDTRKIDPGFEDPLKIQKLQREGLTPGSQKFMKRKK